jgi:putative transposase
MFKAFCYRLYPSEGQALRMEATRETCRRFYNSCLAERKTAYEERGETIGKFEQLRKVKDEKKNNLYAANIHSHVLQVVVSDLDKAFQAFFRRVKAKEKAGYPRFKGFHRFDSFGFKEYGNGFKIDGRRLKLSGIGRVPVRWHRPLEGVVKSLRIIKKADGWYACFSCEVAAQPLPATGQSIGVDVGIESLLTLSDGSHIENPKWYRSEQKKLRVLQRKVARRKKGGMNRRKAVKRLQTQHQRIENTRKDFLNKVAHGLVQNYDHIVLEDLRIKNMVRNHHLSKSILDAGWGYLSQRLAHKAVEAGRVIEFVNPAYTSKTCSACGSLFEGFSLSTRWVDCACGLSLHRDQNAAINILKTSAGTQPLGANGSVVTLPVAQEATAIYRV